MPCAAKEAIKKPEIKKKIIAGNIKRSKSTKQRKALSKGQKRRFSNKAQRESMSESLTKVWSDNPLRKRYSQDFKKLWKNDKWRKKYINSPAVKARIEKQRLPESRKASSERFKKLWIEGILKEFWRKDAQPRKNKSSRGKNGRISSGK